MDEKLRVYGFNSVEELEERYAYVNKMAAAGTPVISNAEWDVLHDLMVEYNPDSEQLKKNWESDEEELTENDELLKQYGMCSITTLKEISMKEMESLCSVIDMAGGSVTLHCGLKENGHAIRAVYRYGELVSGSTRGRYKKGRDITRHLKRRLINYVPEWKDYELVEIRGEALVKVETFENNVKEQYGLKTPLSAVTSFLRDSVTDEELDMVDFVMYKVLSIDRQFDNLYDEYEYLSELGFEIPQHGKLDNVTRGNIIKAVNAFLKYFEGLMDNGEIKYSCDGLVVAINDNSAFYSGGKHGNAWNGNFAVKEGRYWANNVYSSQILEVVWQHGKKFLVPKAIVEPVICRNGTKVEFVPLYNVGVMERYGYTTGNTVYFRYGGETGVTLCDYEGQSCKK